MTRVDLYLLLTAIIWGSNYSVIKFVLQELPARTFNGLRLLVASAVFLAFIYGTSRREHVRRLTWATSGCRSRTGWARRCRSSASR